MVARNSLLISREALRQSVNVIAKDKPWDYVIRNGQSITVNSARRVIRLLIEAEDCEQVPLLVTYHSPLHALYVLVVQLIKHPESKMSKTDLEVSPSQPK